MEKAALYKDRLLSGFDSAIQDLEGCPTAQLTAGACIARMCFVEIACRQGSSIGLGQYCLAAERSRAFRGVLACVHAAIQVSFALFDVLTSRVTVTLVC